MRPTFIVDKTVYVDAFVLIICIMYDQYIVGLIRAASFDSVTPYYLDIVYNDDVFTYRLPHNNLLTTTQRGTTEG